MVSMLIAALVLISFCCLRLGWVCYRQIGDREKIEDITSRLNELREENKQMGRYLSDVLYVLNSNVGGISKRISESAEIAETILSQTPDLFTRSDGLAYWLHANDQFLINLYVSAVDCIDPDHRRRFHEMKETGRAAVFDRIYEVAGLPAPQIRACQRT